jgi:hypothetical protein
VWAVYQGTGDLLVHSKVHRVRVGNPLSSEEDRLAHDFFTDEVGLSLYLGGSQSPFLSEGMELLEDIAGRYKETLLGAKAATTVASSVARPFFRLQDGVMSKTHSAEPEKALALTEPALELYRSEDSKPLNIAYHQLARSRAEFLQTLDQNEKAKEELAALQEDLKDRGVNKVVLSDIKAYRESL